MLQTEISGLLLAPHGCCFSAGKMLAGPVLEGNSANLYQGDTFVNSWDNNLGMSKSSLRMLNKALCRACYILAPFEQLASRLFHPPPLHLEVGRASFPSQAVRGVYSTADDEQAAGRRKGGKCQASSAPEKLYVPLLMLSHAFHREARHSRHDPRKESQLLLNC